MSDIKKEAYVEVDKNLIVETVFPDTEDVKFHNVRNAPFELYNLYGEQDEIYRRLPKDVAAETSKGVDKLAKESAGVRVRFSTDSLYILIKAKMPIIGRNSHMTLLMSAGFDLYEDTPTGSRFVKSFMPPYKMEDGYEQIIRFGSRKMRYFTINFPLHSVVSEFYVGLQEDSVIGAGKPYKNEKPIIIYGSSIVHGTGASRPGLAYSNIISRKLGMNIVNLGFSGNAKAELPIMNYLASLDMCLFVYDYDHNAPNPEYLRETHKRGYDIIRAAHPDIPIILITRPNAATNPSKVEERKKVVIDTYRAALDAGDRHVYYIDGESFFLGMDGESDFVIDGVHPNDVGYYLMAEGIGNTILQAIERNGGSLE